MMGRTRTRRSAHAPRRIVATIALAVLGACASAPPPMHVTEPAPVDARVPCPASGHRLAATPILAILGFGFGLFHGGPQASRADSQRDGVIGAVIGGALGWVIDSRGRNCTAE
jgi:hypothetical protein